MTPQDAEQLLVAIRAIHRDTHAPVRTSAVAIRCYMGETWARILLNRLAEEGRVIRIGQRRGWLPKE